MKGGKSKIITAVAGIFVVASTLWGIALLLAIKPVASVELRTGYKLEPTGQEINFTWPTQGAAAVGMDNKIKADFNGNEQRAMASLTKVITALVVLNKKPMNPGEIGEIVTMTDKDVAYYEKAKATGGSNLAVSAGEQITQADMIRAMMMVSANNIADSLVNWAFGSEADFLDQAKAWLAANGFTSTTIADASGLSPESVSTANELVKLAMIADRNEILKEAFSRKESQFPSAGKITNTNILLGVNDIYGLKTGHTAAAGANLLFASKIKIGNDEKAIYGVVLGQSDENLFQVAQELNNSAQSNVGKVVALAKGAVVGQVTSKWGTTSDVVLTRDLTVIDWKDENDAVIAVNTVNKLTGMTSVAGGQLVAVATTGFEEVNAITKDPVRSPDLLWRITNPF
jgi:D-alanyl-D-alanine carboxypeptidase (penicillin-binding protein 5/6)